MTSTRLNAALRALGFSALTAAFFSYLPANDSSCLFSGAACAAAEDEVREWTDSTGKFKVQAKLVSQDEKSVKLRKTDGRTVTLPFSKLSKQDLDYLSALEKSEDAENPFAGGIADEDDVLADSNGSFKLGGKSLRVKGLSIPIKIGDRTGSKKPVASPNTEWKVKLEIPQRKPLEPVRGIDVGASLLGNSYASEITFVFPSDESSEIIAGYSTGLSDERRYYIDRFDLDSGSTSTAEILGVKTNLADVSPDGKYVLTIEDVPAERLDFSNKQALLGIYSLENVKTGANKALRPVALFNPYGSKDSSLGDKAIERAYWIDSAHILTNNDHEIACWDLSTGKAVYTVAFESKVELYLDPTRRVLGVVGEKLCALYDALTGETLGVVANPTTEGTIVHCACAFSPSGKKFAACFGEELYVVDSANGKTIGHFAVESVLHEPIVWTSEDYLFLGDQLYDLELALPLCKYSGGVGRFTTTEHDGLVWFISGSSIAGYEFPHKAALDAKKKLVAKDSFALYPGAHAALKIETNGLLDEKDVRKILEARFAEQGLVLDPKSKVVVKATAVDTKEEEEVAYGAADPQYAGMPHIPYPTPYGKPRGTVMGTIKLKVFEQGLDVYDGDKLLSSARQKTVGPHEFEYDPDKTLEESIRKTNIPELEYYKFAALPRYLSKEGKRAGMTARAGVNGVE